MLGDVNGRHGKGRRLAQEEGRQEAGPEAVGRQDRRRQGDGDGHGQGGRHEKSVKVNFEKVKGSWLLELPEEFFQQPKKK